MLDVKLPFPLRVNDCLLILIAFFAVSYSLAAFYRVLNADEVRPAVSVASCVVAFFAVSYCLASFYRVLNADEVRPAVSVS